jgi:2-methylcitrate dehydratase PrpD
VFGAAAAAGKLAALSPERLAHAFGLAASSAGGLFAFVNGGGDIKRLHAGHAAREGLQAALLAEQGIEGPPGVIEARDGFMQAFGRAEKSHAALASEASGQRGHSKSARARPSPEPGSSARAIALPPEAPFGITHCYIKPYPCCRHIQPAVEALIGILEEANIAGEEVERVEVATYRIAAEHAATGWDDFASAQLSFPYLIALALKFRGVKFEHFADAVRLDPALAAMARKLTVTAPPDVDRLYPQLRPARVTIATARGSYTRQAEEARGSRLLPLDDAALKTKFLDLVGPVLGAARANDLAARLWSLEAIDDVALLVESMAKPASAATQGR